MMENTMNFNLYLSLLELPDKGQWRDPRHLKTCADMLTGLLCASMISLTKWIPYAFGRHTIAQSVQRRYIRWLENVYIDIRALYAPLIIEALSKWGDHVVYLAFDTTMLWNTFCIIRVSIVYRGRAIPLAWKVIRHNSSTVAFKEYKSVLIEAKSILDNVNKRVVLLADRGFADTELMKLCDRFGWGFRIRIKGTFKVHSKKGKEYYVEELCPKTSNKAFLFITQCLQGKSTDRCILRRLMTKKVKKNGISRAMMSPVFTHLRNTDSVLIWRKTFRMTNPTDSNSKVPLSELPDLLKGCALSPRSPHFIL